MIRGGYGRSYDIGVFGSLFGHTVTQNLPVLSVQDLNAPNNFDSVFNLAQGPPPPNFVAAGADGRFRWPNGVGPRVAAAQAAAAGVDAWNVRCSAVHDTMSVEVGYVGNHGRNVFVGDDPAMNVNQPTLEGFPRASSRTSAGRSSPATCANVARASAAHYGWTSRASTTSATGRTTGTTRCRPSHQALQRRLVRAAELHAAEGRQNNDGDTSSDDPDLNRGPADLDRTHNFTVGGRLRAAVRQGPAVRQRLDAATDAVLGGWQFNTNVFIQSGFPFNVTYRNAGEDRDTGRRTAPDLIGDPDGPKTQDEWFNATPIGSAGQRIRPAGARHVRQSRT